MKRERKKRRRKPSEGTIAKRKKERKKSYVDWGCFLWHDEGDILGAD